MRSIWIAILLAILIWSCNWTPDEFDIKNISTYKQLQIIRGLKSSFDLDGYDFKVVEYPNPDIANVSSDAAGHFELTGLAPGNTSMSIEYLVDSESESGLSSVIYVQVQVSNGIPVDIFVADTLDLDIRLYLNEATTLATDSMDVQYPGGASLVHSEVKLTPETFILKFIGLSPGDDSLVVNFYDVADTIILSLPFEIESSIKKIPLIEVFTNSGCINCPEANHYLDNIYNDYNDDITLVRYHVNWTDPNDPMNLYNPDEVADRVSFYNIFVAPGLVLDGSLISSLNENDWISRINTASREEASVYISPMDLDESSDSLLISFNLESFEASLADMNIWSLVLEDSIEFPGSNGERIHMQVMRDMTQSQASGTLVNFNVSHHLKKPDMYGNGAPMTLLVFLQDTATQRVIQSRKQIIF